MKENDKQDDPCDDWTNMPIPKKDKEEKQQ